MQNQVKNRLGRGLTALLGEEYNGVSNFVISNKEETNTDKILHINVNDIVKSNENPRYKFDKNEIIQLANSIKEHGVLQPIIVKPYDNNKYMIIAGERRWRATKEVGITTIPSIIKDIDEKKALELAIIENIQRSDLNTIEEALGYKQLIEIYGYSQDELAQKVGFSRSHITNMLRLLTLPEEVKQLLEENKITSGHARCLINRSDAKEWALKIVKNQLSVRKLEEALKVKNTPLKKEANIGWLELEKNLSKLIKLDVKIKKRQQGGQLIINYNDEHELLNFLEKLKINPVS